MSTTAKVILQDGRLIEFSAPLKALKVLVDCPGSFICDADDMDFENYVREIGEEEELCAGQIYFLLPRSVLRRRLRLEEMVNLAVKASSALMKSGGDERRRRVFAVDQTAGRLSRRRNSDARLGAIPEDSAPEWSI